ncbi:TonB-dependent siderophore receptor [Pseudomonas sp. MAFF 302030]|uniref:TonB-dependent siderophore receptor n=1 Tax=Pseudomonas morbosilactucae TaxID=2938197 RepID=A0A9X2C829_9PSED|nr:TonB-dependent siderophore receptor [Pseudomonas morbosilactucae]MCK9800345.1 TonB-dependent siderophore receptor [Pseudomonas morbosilactucae]
MTSPLGFIRLHPLRHAVCLAAGFCLHNGAYAQPDAVSDPSLWSRSWTLEPINVSGNGESYSAPSSASATRTETPLIEVPQSVQVVTRAMLREQDSHSLADALVNVSGVRATKPQEALFTQPIVRGFPAEIYMNGLPAFGGTAASIDPTSLIGTERIEVLKGPTSALYGGGIGAPLGGLINVISKRPGAEPSAFLSMRTGSFGTVNPSLDLNTPIGDKVAARISADYQENDSWIDHVEGHQWSVQPSIAFQLSPETELLLRGQYEDRSQLEFSGLPAAQALSGQIDRNAFPGSTRGQPHTTIENRTTTAELKHELSDDTRMTVTAQYYEGKMRDNGAFIFPELLGANPATPTVYPIFKLYLPTNIRESTLDSNLGSRFEALGGTHELLVGASYDRTDFTSGVSNAELIGELDLASPRYGLSYGATPETIVTQTNRYETKALYLQDQATYGRFHLLGSLRLTQLNLKQQEQGVDTSYHRVTPRLGITYDLTQSLALYAAYSTGFRGAFNFNGRETPKPELSRNYEAGVKLAFKDLGLTGTLAAFEQTRRNVSTPDPDPTNAILGYSVQSGEQRARGVEADLVWEPTQALSLLANYAYTQAEVTDDNSIPVGDGLPRVPRHSGRFAARYRILDGAAKGLGFGAGVTALSARELTLPNTVSVPGYALLDAQASYDFDRYTLSVSAVNLTGRKVFETYQYLGSPVVLPTQPRSAYFTLTASF